MSTAHIYVDGACLRNGRPDAVMGIGVYWHRPSIRQNDISEPYSEGKSTNQRAELEAARRGIQQCKNLGYRNIVVYLDSHYVMKGATEWIPRWERNGYITSAGYAVANEQDFRNLKNAMRNVGVRFIKVDRADNYADELAKCGAAEEFHSVGFCGLAVVL